MSGRWDKENIKGNVIDKEVEKKKKRQILISMNSNCVYHLELSKHVKMTLTR